MDHLNGKTELLKQTHILKDHLNGKTRVVETNTHSNGFFIPIEWNGWNKRDQWVSVDGGDVILVGSFTY